MRLKIQAYKSLIEDYKKLPVEEYNPTLLEITGYSHREDIISNVLAFYFNSSNPHGFSNLLVEALLDIVDPECESLASEELVVENVEREVSTQENKYIDLVVTTSSHIIGIENKIHAGLYNPLGSYRNHIDYVAKNYGKQPINILLTLKKSNYSPDELMGFEHLTYEQFFWSVEESIGKKLAEADQNYLSYFIDFQKTIQNMGNIELSDEFREFIIEHHESINRLNEDVFNKYERFAKNKLDQINSMIEFDSLAEIEENKLILKKGRLEAVRFYSFKEDVYFGKKQLNLQIKIRLKPVGYSIELWDYDTDKEKHLEPFMESVGFNTKLNMEEGKKSDSFNYSYIHKEFDLDERIDKVAEELQNVFLKVFRHIDMSRERN